MRTPGRHLARALILAMSLVAAALTVPAIAAAGVPTILAVGQIQHHATASWALPPGTVTRLVEISDSPAVSTDGSFFGDHVRSSDAVTDAQATYTSTALFDPGVYYIHVAGNVPNCDTCPEREWSAVTPLTIPPFVQALVEGSGQVTGPGGLSCANATCLAADEAPGTVLLTATPAAGWLVLSWSIEGIDASDFCGIAPTTCTVTVSATRASTVTVRFAPAVPTVIRAGAKAFACAHRVEVVNPKVQPEIDTAHPYLGTLTVALQKPSGGTITRKLKNINGYFTSPDFYKLKPASTYTITVKYSGDEWRPAKSFSKKVKLGRC